MIPDELAGLALPWSARAQAEVDEADLELTEYARLRRPTVRWWWGRRTRGGAAVALCYACGAEVTTWAGRYPITDRAIDALRRHRAVHVGPARPRHGIDPVGSPPAGEAAPQEGPA